MDPKTSKYLHHLPEGAGVRKEKPFDFDDSFPDSLVKLFHPMANKSNLVEAPPTPGRPVFSFSVGSRKNFPSKWDDAQKWLISGPDSPAHHHHHHRRLLGFVKSPDHVPKHSSNGGGNGSVVKQHQQQQQQQQQQEKYHHKTEVSSGVAEEKVSKATSVYMELQDHQHHNSHKPFNAPEPSDVLLKDKFTNGEENFSRFKCLVPIKEGFLFSSMKDASTEVVQEVKQRDNATNLIPLGSSRCLTPFKSVSPPRHNTPASMSGPLALMNASSSFDIAELQECHLAKLQLDTPFDSVTCNWSSREEEEEDVSKSLRHFEMKNEFPKSIPEPGPRPCAWEEEEEEKTKSHLRYQREEAKIQAWVNLQNAKAEAQSRKLEVKIQKLRSKFEEKMMKKMASVHRKAEELRVAARYEHNMQLRKATTTRSKKTKDVHESVHFPGHGGSCSCFPCNALHP